jgi:predicted CXXCH cytochrome family protein
MGALHLRVQSGAPPVATPDPEPAFVGSQQCAACHRRESEAWRTSQHARALQAATDKTVLGDFDSARFEKAGVVTTFRKHDGRFLIDTQGSDGKPGEFEVKFTLGLYPLQQYLVELPGGRLQAFGIAWDTRAASAGGHRWFDLYPGQKLAPGDPLHWTGIQQTANFMCIDCHVTDFRKGYDAAANAYHSTWSEAGVGCEACHGPAGAHLANPRVKLPARFPPRSQNVWGTDPATRPNGPAEGRTAEVETCARCHARRSQLTDVYHAGQPFADGFHTTLLDRGVYRVDGQMQDEVFNYGSFLQSRMFSKGVSCSDCHDPHTQELRAEGNALCGQCHEAAKYDSRTHHFHDPASKAGQCVSCHMPGVTYMIVDPRHDHGFRVPRPDIADSLGVPDVCAGCHRDKPKGWAAQELERRLGHAPSGFQTFAEAFSAADQGAPGATGLLARIANDGAQSAIVRASAIARSNGLDPALAGIDLRRALADPNPLVRTAAAEAIAADDASPWATALTPLLRDPIRGVRIEAARALAGPTELRLPESDRESFRRALDEYIAVQAYNADRPESHMNLALLEIRRGNTLLADDHLAHAIAVDPGFVPAYVQRADLYRARHDEPAAERILRAALDHGPQSALAHFQLGLTLVRQRRGQAALEELHRAAALDPATARYGYVYAVALDQAGRPADARTMLESVLARHPYDIESLVAAATWSLRRGENQAALGYLMTLRAVRPDDRGVAREIERLQRPPRR